MPPRRPLRRVPDLYIGTLLILLGVYIAYEGHHLGVGSMHEPGSGFILFWTGVALAVIAAAVTASAPFVPPESVPGTPFAEVEWRTMVVVMLTLVAYAAALEPLGFLPATALMLLVLFRAVDPLSWPAAIIGAIGTTIIVYVVFGLGLGTQFPMGLLGNR
jgi:putative tricarboxylic transport membrane protein